MPRSSATPAARKRSTTSAGLRLRSVADLSDLRGRRVLVRVDHNVEPDPQGTLKDDRKVRLTLPTLQMLLARGARVILLTHVGRPKGKHQPQLSTAAVASHLRGLLPGVAIAHLPAIAGPSVEEAVRNLRDGEVLYLQNVRFDPREEGSPREQEALAQELAVLADLYVNEAFASCHQYEEASTCALARLLPGCAGLNVLQEVAALSPVVDDPRRPLVVIISGAKMKTKIPVIRRFLGVADHLLLGGCLANTFLAGKGFDVGKSVYEPDFVETAQEIMLESEAGGKAVVHVPRDVVVCTEESEQASKLDLPVEDIEGDMRIVDVGKVTLKRYMEIVAQAGTIVWNGPLGRYEFNRFSHGTKRLAEAIAATTDRGACSVVGGGDTLDFHALYGKPLQYSFVSSGGGAMLEFLEDPTGMPALQALCQRGRHTS